MTHEELEGGCCAIGSSSPWLPGPEEKHTPLCEHASTAIHTVTLVCMHWPLYTHMLVCTHTPTSLLILHPQFEFRLGSFSVLETSKQMRNWTALNWDTRVRIRSLAELFVSLELETKYWSSSHIVYKQGQRGQLRTLFCLNLKFVPH